MENSYSDILSKAIYSEQERFHKAIHRAKAVELKNKNWQSLSSILPSRDRQFHYITYWESLILGINDKKELVIEDGSAVQLLRWELEMTQKKLSVALAWAYGIPAMLILMRVLDFFR